MDSLQQCLERDPNEKDNAVEVPLTNTRGGGTNICRLSRPISSVCIMPPFLRKSCTQWPRFSLQSTPSDPLFKKFQNFARFACTFCFWKSHTQWPPFFYKILHRMLPVFRSLVGTYRSLSNSRSKIRSNRTLNNFWIFDFVVDKKDKQYTQNPVTFAWHKLSDMLYACLPASIPIERSWHCLHLLWGVKWSTIVKLNQQLCWKIRL